MNHADRRRLVERLLLARAAADVQDAREMARAWLAQHPGDSGIRSATECLGMVEEALRRLGLWDVPPESPHLGRAPP
ncbi:MAG: hypothetical protein HY332_23645 [Chloroflexi bacterium]|nr:hypothetical protein [Chloroflexota bacterium]